MKLIKTLAASLLVLMLFSCSKSHTSKKSNIVEAKITASNGSAVAETESGKVAGYIDDDIYIFKGIPYAEAERFMPPHSPQPWEGIRSSRAYGPTCPQGKRTGWYSDEQAFAFDWDDGFSDEDCLRINIWTKRINNREKRPVMVWLHGGAYSAGSGQELPSYDGTQLCKKGDVVIVTLNHRLNVLGFLDLSAFGDKYATSGNVGLLDLVAALKWVHNNIENFGGDPANVTIFGQSGGGGKVSTLMATPQAQGLFHKAIVQSGSILNTMETKYSRRIGLEIVNELNLNASEIDKLSDIPYEQLLSAGNKAIKKIQEEAKSEGFEPMLFGWEPTVDGNVLPLQPAEPKAMLQSKDVPLLVGTTLHEFTSSISNPALRHMNNKDAVKELEKKYGNKTEEVLTAFRKAYPEYQLRDLLDIDFFFRPEAVKHAMLKTGLQGAPVYNYLFTWESPVLDGMFRSTHCMEIPFVFNNISRCKTITGGDRSAYQLADKISSAWLNFAKTGNPNTDGLPGWEPFTAEKRATMILNDHCEVKYNHDKDLLEIVSLFK